MEGALPGKKKILFLITKGNWGGAQKYVFDLATSLSKDRFDIAVASGKDGMSTDTLTEKLTGAGIRTFGIPRLGRDVNIVDDILVFFDLIKLFKTERPDVVHVNSPKIGGLGALAARCTGIRKIVFTAHGWTWNEDRSWLAKKCIVFFSWLTIIFSNTVIVLGEKEKAEAERLPFCRGKIVMIPNGVKPIDFIERTEARNILTKTAEKLFTHTPEKKLSTDGLWIGTISELHKNKGLDVILNALAHVSLPVSLPKASSVKNQTPLFFVMSEGEERKNLEALIQKLGLEKRVFLLGHVDGASRYLKAFDIFTLTSRKEGLPYAILEAGLAGLPVIASNVGNIPDIIENQKSGILVAAKDSSELQAALEFLIADAGKRQELGKNLEARVRQNFSFQKMLEKTESLY